MAAGYAYPWMTFSADVLHRNGFAGAANVLRGGPWNGVPAEEIAVAYDFLCDLYAERQDEDVQRTAHFLGRCQRIGFGLAFAEAAEPILRDEVQPDFIANRRMRRAERRGEIARAMKESLARQRREERRAAKRKRERMVVR